MWCVVKELRHSLPQHLLSLSVFVNACNQPSKSCVVVRSSGAAESSLRLSGTDLESVVFLSSSIVCTQEEKRVCEKKKRVGQGKKESEKKKKTQNTPKRAQSVRCRKSVANVSTFVCDVLCLKRGVNEQRKKEKKEREVW